VAVYRYRTGQFVPVRVPEVVIGALNPDELLGVVLASVVDALGLVGDGLRPDFEEASPHGTRTNGAGLAGNVAIRISPHAQKGWGAKRAAPIEVGAERKVSHR